jgi:hypothetical protein
MAGLNQDFSAYLTGQNDGFNAYSAGNKDYGPGRSAPNIGPSDKAGYQMRDNRASMMRNAMLTRLKAYQQGNFASPAAMRPQLDSFYSGRPGGY